MDPAWPPGFVYRPALLGEDEETRLVAGVRGLAFGEVRMRGVVARRRTAHFGWLYGYESWRIEPGPPIPPFLLPLRERVAALAGVDAGRFVEILVSEYTAGAGIGWHRDAPMFGVVVGVSLLGACRLRFRRSVESPRGTRAVALAPRLAAQHSAGADPALLRDVPDAASSPGGRRRARGTCMTSSTFPDIMRGWRRSSRRCVSVPPSARRPVC